MTGRRLGIALLAVLPGCASAASSGPAQLSRSEAQTLLLASMQCVDDGSTFCDVAGRARSVRLTRLDCVPETPVASRRERARLACRVGGRIRWSDGSSRPLPGGRAGFFLVERGGGVEWQTGGFFVR